MKVLIIEDHTLIRRGLKADILEIDEHAQVFQAETFEDGQTTLKAQKIDIVILDIDIPDGEGIRMIDLIREKNSDIKILVHSGYDEKEYAVPYLRAGANGYVSKRASNEEFVTAWQTIVQQRKYISPAVQELLLDNIGVNAAADINNAIASLSPKELRVMHLIIEGKWTKEIAIIMDVKQNTISTYKKRIFEKLDVRDEQELSKKVAPYL